MITDDSTIEDVKNDARGYFSNSRGSHDWDHTRRVYNLCMHIGRIEKADMAVIRIAAYLHDVGRSHENASRGAVCHAEKGAVIARALLTRYPIPEKRKDNVIHAIRAHRFRGDCRPETREAKVLFDADKLDSIGAIGIGRAFQFAGEVGATLHNPHVEPEDTEPYTENDTGYREFRLKLSKIKDRMLTGEGRRMAEERHTFMDLFFERFLLEHEGHK